VDEPNPVTKLKQVRVSSSSATLSGSVGAEIGILYSREYSNLFTSLASK
jgi:hypothetical protein